MIDLYQEQAEAWATFDENNACKTCGAQVSEFNQVTHYRWHQQQGSAKPADKQATPNRKGQDVAQTDDD